MGISFPVGFKALVVGSSGAIGGAFVDHLRQHTACGEVVCVDRSGFPGFDLQDASSIERLGAELAGQGPFHFIVDATGALVIDGVGPEKSLAQLDCAALQRSFAVNALGPAVLLRHLATRLASGDMVYSKLSARVGSIADNRKGGWYGYRASKAALNMVLQTAAVELQRRHPGLRVVALQPGTVRSRLSAPFATGVPELLEPAESVAGLMRAMLALPRQSGAQFIDYRGQTVPW